METTSQSVMRLVAHAQQELGKRIVGQQEMLQQCMVGLLVGGHVLLEGVPGLAKTLMVKSIGDLLELRFQRIQGTSDLMPADVIGTNVFNPKDGSFSLHKGPVFADVVLVDEINRMPPRTQAALLEGMQERQVTIDGVRHPLDRHFTVFATQNPVEFEGTYPLPEAQLDRFLLKVTVPYPEEDEEITMLENLSQGQTAAEDVPITPLGPGVIDSARAEIADVKCEPTLWRYVVKLARATRSAPQITLGASPRATLSLLFVAKAYAAMDDREYVIPDDVKRALLPVLRHRIILRPEVELEGIQTDQVLTEISKSVEVPK